MFISPTHSSLANGNVNILPPTNTSDKVTLALYYETLCPYCADFITNDLVKVFLSDLYTIVNLKLVPWGNADILGDEPHCQHGEDECYLNTIHSCVIYYWPDVKKHFDFIRCTEQQSSKKPLVKNRAAIWQTEYIQDAMLVKLQTWDRTFTEKMNVTSTLYMPAPSASGLIRESISTLSTVLKIKAFPSRIISTLTVWKQCGKPALPDPVWIRNSSRTAMTVDMEERQASST
ncbi:gamma-interferon-inducible lysosomal thiol reductase-like [Gossypium australe]|uniref:Gamma-interferon-inducible lysosomal thiol reductase-like n=1 Tax=Gossypium australe TaxID=47621 RepID=A0A5B6V3M3_9ROSI|nr:gamma-interferon-inducible lysosomal thiol reductase-like [Gossypium australe]